MINFEQFKAISIWSADVQTKAVADPSSWRRRNQKKQPHLSSWIIKQRLSNRDSGTLFWKGQKEKDQSGHSWEAAQPSCRLSCLKCHPNSSHLLILPRGQRVVELSRLTLTITSKKVSGRFGGEELWSRRWQKIIESHKQTLPTSTENRWKLLSGFFVDADGNLGDVAPPGKILPWGLHASKSKKKWKHPLLLLPGKSPRKDNCNFWTTIRTSRYEQSFPEGATPEQRCWADVRTFKWEHHSPICTVWSRLN